MGRYIVKRLLNLLPAILGITLFPGLFIALTMLAFNLLGDGLHDSLDP